MFVGLLCVYLAIVVKPKTTSKQSLAHSFSFETFHVIIHVVDS